MKNRPRIKSVLAIVTVLAGGCAASPPRDVARYDDGVDHPRIASVERAARGRGVDIHWINLPQRRPGTAAAATEPLASPAPTGT